MLMGPRLTAQHAHVLRRHCIQNKGNNDINTFMKRGRHGHDRMVVGLTITYPINPHHH